VLQFRAHSDTNGTTIKGQSEYSQQIIAIRLKREQGLLIDYHRVRDSRTAKKYQVFQWFSFEQI